jgi:hypothetical protein
MKFLKTYQTTIISIVCLTGILAAENTVIIGALSCVLVYFIFKKIIGF